MTKRFESFDEFWPFYVGEHKDPKNRALHYVGTSIAIGSIAMAALTRKWRWLLLAPLGYAPAWVGHFVIEGNRPATFTYPLWSLQGDLKMLSLALRGKMADEVERLHPTTNAAAPTAARATPRAEPRDVGVRAHAEPHN